MKILRLAPLCAILMIITSGCSTFHSLTARNDSLEFQGISFRVNAAHEAFIGSIGLKRTESKNRFELKFTPLWDNLALKNTTKFDLSLAQTVEKSLEVKGETHSGNNNLNAGLSSSSDGSLAGKYHLLRIVDTKALVDQLNESKNNDLREYIFRSSDYRIITSAVIVYDHATSKKLANTSNLKLEMKSDSTGNATIDIKSNGTSVKKLSMSDGTIFAYEFSRICWSKNASGAIKVADILLDRNIWRGDSSACLKNTVSNPLELTKSKPLNKHPASA